MTGDLAISLLPVAGVAGLGSGDALPGRVAFRLGELDCRDVGRLAADLDLGLVGVGREIVVPGWVRDRTARRGEDQSGSVAVGKRAAQRRAPLARLGTDRGQHQGVHARRLAAAGLGATESLDHLVVHELHHRRDERRHARAVGAARSLLERQLCLPGCGRFYPWYAVGDG